MAAGCPPDVSVGNSPAAMRLRVATWALMSASLLAPTFGQKLLQFVSGKQQGIDHRRSGNQLPAPDQAEDILRHMGEILDDDQPHEAGTALDGMGGPEDLVDPLLVNVCPPAFDGQKVVFDIGKVLDAILL